MPTTRSHSPAFSVFLMKPRRCAHQVYCTSTFISRAMRAAILFSNPSSRSFEKGRLFGSAQTRRCWRGGGGGGACRVCFSSTFPAQERRHETSSRSGGQPLILSNLFGYMSGKRENIE